MAHMHERAPEPSQNPLARDGSASLDVCMRAAHAAARAHARKLRALGVAESELLTLFSPSVLIDAGLAEPVAET